MEESMAPIRDFDGATGTPEDFTPSELVDGTAEPPTLPLRPLIDRDGLVSTRQGPLFRDDFVLATTSEQDAAEYERLAPPEGLSPAQRRVITTEPIPLTVEEEPERRMMQF